MIHEFRVVRAEDVGPVAGLVDPRVELGLHAVREAGQLLRRKLPVHALVVLPDHNAPRDRRGSEDAVTVNAASSHVCRYAEHLVPPHDHRTLFTEYKGYVAAGCATLSPWSPGASSKDRSSSTGIDRSCGGGSSSRTAPSSTTTSKQSRTSSRSSH